MHPNNRRMMQIVIDALCIATVGIIPLIAKVGGLTPFARGFFCDDETLKHPYHDSTVSSALMASLACLIPLALMIIIESILYRQGVSSGHEPFTLGRFSVNGCVVTIVARYCVFIFGMGVTQTFTDLTKFTIGRLRPHFFAVCEPDYSRFNCSQGYITLDVCTTTDIARLTEARLSFLSGHTSIAVFAALYTAVYLQARMIWSFSRLLQHLLQVMAILAAWLTALSRISDYKHHPEDVLMGAVLGLSTCVVVVLFISDLPPPSIQQLMQFRHKFSKSNQSNDVHTTAQNKDVEMGGQAQYHTFATNESALLQ